MYSDSEHPSQRLEYSPPSGVPFQVATAAAIDDRPSCFRFPRGNGVGVDLAAAGIKDMKGVPLEVRQWEEEHK